MKTKAGLSSVVVLLVVLCSSVTTLFAATGAVLPGSKHLLQYRSGGHIMGFMPGKVYFASMDHALSVEFIGGSGNKPNELNSRGMGNDKGPKSLGRVEYKDSWPGITLRFDKVDKGIAESTYEVQPGADISKIRLKYNVPVTLRENGKLKFAFGSGDMTESAPVAWQEIDGKRHPVKVAFMITEGTVGFNVGKYDKTQPLIIDPTYQWHTFYGSSGDDEGATAIAIDNSGNIYLTGGSGATWNGPSGQSPLNEHSLSGIDIDVFILKLDSNGSYQWHTFYGYAIGYAITIDAGGNVYVAGSTPDTWNGPSGQLPLHPRSKSNISFWDIFILKLNSSGAYQWHTFYGSSSDNDQDARGIAVDSSCNVYVTGSTGATWNGDNNAPPLHAYSGVSDAFVIKLNTGGTYQWHAFYGSSGNDYGRQIALDTIGSIYVVGASLETWNGPSGQSPLHAHADSWNIYILKLNSNGAYQWHTFYGSYDDGRGIALDSSGNIYVTGWSQNTWNGPSGQSPLHALSSGFFPNDIFILKLNSSGAYQWHTFYGANNSSYKYGIAVNCNSDVFITGLSSATWNGASGESPYHAFSGNSDTFILKLNRSGTYQWHTFYGSNDPIAGNNGILTDGSGNLYVAGYTAVDWNGDGNATPLHAYSGAWDIFVLKLYDQGGECGNVCIQRGSSIVNFYATLQDAYNAAVDGDTIKMRAMDLTEDLTFADNIVVSLQGGYNFNYVLNSGMTTLIGCLTISRGTVIIEKLIIK